MDPEGFILDPDLLYNLMSLVPVRTVIGLQQDISNFTVELYVYLSNQQIVLQ